LPGATLGVAAAAVLAGGYVLGGQAGCCAAALAVVAVSAVVLRARWSPERIVPDPRRSDAVGGSGRFSEYDRLVSRLAWARQDYRTFDRALAPQLWQLANDLVAARNRPRVPGTAPAGVDRAGLAARLGPEVASVLDPDRARWEDPPGGRRAGPSVQHLAQIIERIESL
jgi:hypothetical protein